MKHTPTPWEIRRGNPITENEIADVCGVKIFGPYKAVTCGDEARFIVEACNAYERLKDAIKNILRERSCACYRGDPRLNQEDGECALCKAKEAIALCEGGEE